MSNQKNSIKESIFAKKITTRLNEGLNLDATIQSRLEFARKQALANIVSPLVMKKPSGLNKVKSWSLQWFNPRVFATASAFIMIFGVIQISGEDDSSTVDMNYISQYVSTADSFDIQ